MGHDHMGHAGLRPTRVPQTTGTTVLDSTPPPPPPDVPLDPKRMFAWQDESVCSSVGVDLFYAGDEEVGGTAAAHATVAKRICSSCPVWRECRFFGLGEPYGIWGGMSVAERSRVRRAMGLSLAGWHDYEYVRVKLMEEYAKAGYNLETVARRRFPGLESVMGDPGTRTVVEGAA